MITFEKIQQANLQIKTTDVKGKDYAEVNQRIKAFRMICPNGSITTEIVSIEKGLKGNVVIFKATIKNEEEKIIGTGTAYEVENSSFINKTSYIENCETSAIGRALAMCGIGIETSVASYEEIANANKQQEKSEGKLEEQEKIVNYPIDNVKFFINQTGQRLGISSQKAILEKLQPLVKFPIDKNITEEQAEVCINLLKGM